jgi:hypothetical protein
MFGTIRRHQAWLWWFIGGITIISFVILGPSSCVDLKMAGRGRVNLGSIGDHPITADELVQAKREVALRYFMTSGRWPDGTEFDVNREALLRLFFIAKQKQFGITVSQDSLGELGRNLLRQFGGQQLSLDIFLDQLLKPKGYDENDLERLLTHELGMQQLVAVAGLSGRLVTPGEAETLYREEYQEVASSMILLSVSNYLPTVSVTNPALQQFYTNRMSEYREPARVQVNYVRFNVTNYFPQTIKAMTNLDTVVDIEVKKMGTNLFGHTKTPEESRAAVKDFIVRTNALVAARHDATDFANELDAMQPKKPENLEALAKQKKLTFATTEPFDEVQGPKGLDVLYNFSRVAFQVTQDDPFVIAPEHDGVYVLGFDKQFPSYVPPFSAVSDKVLADFRLAQGAFAAMQSASNIYNNLTTGLDQGKTFTMLTAQMGLKTESLPPFSLSTEKLPESLANQVSLEALRRATFGTEVGHVSYPGRAQYGMFMVYVEKKLPVDEAKMKVELPGFVANMRQGRQSDAFNQWLQGQVRQDPGFAMALQQVSEESMSRQPPRRR